MKVKIIKASKGTYWYANKIGCEFEVEENVWYGKKEYRVIKELKTKHSEYDGHFFIQIKDTNMAQVKVILI